MTLSVSKKLINKRVLKKQIWKLQWRGQALFAHGEPNARGCMILIKKHVPTVIHHTIKDEKGRFLIADVTVRYLRMTLCNVYAPYDDDPECFQKVFQKIESLEPKTIVLVGDFNTTLNAKDKVSQRGTNNISHPKSVEYINMFCEKHNIVDIWRLRNPNAKRYTWFKSKPFKLCEQLDYILVSANISNYVLDADIDPMFMSDHSIPHITMKELGSSDKGPGYWKFNVKHLEDSDYEYLCKNIFKEVEQYEDTFLRWEMLKMNIRGETIKFGARKKKSRMNILEALQNKLYQLQIQKDENTLLTKCEEQMVLLNKDIEDIISSQTIASQQYNQTNWMAYGEKSTSYFFNLEKRHFKNPLVRLQVGETIYMKILR